MRWLPLVMLAVPVWAQDAVSPTVVLDACLLRSDQAFETTLGFGTPLDHPDALPFYRSATWAPMRCMEMAVTLCEVSSDIEACRIGFAAHAVEVIARRDGAMELEGHASLAWEALTWEN